MGDEANIVRELGLEETYKAADALIALRKHFSSAASITAAVNEQRGTGYRLVASFNSQNPEKAMGVAGFRIIQNLHAGRVLYVDDLSTLPEGRKQGHAGGLLNWIAEEARRCGCQSLHLDSGVQSERMDAHRFYFNRGMRITSYHFAKEV